MACFRIYNIQLLPINSEETGEIGKRGYRLLFKTLKKKVVQAIEDRDLDPLAYSLQNDTKFVPFTISIRGKYATGEWIKYQNADKLWDLYSAENLYEKEQGTVPIANQKNFTFLFDYEYHRFAITENGTSLPGIKSCREALIETFEKISSELFPNHTLTVNLVSDSKKLDEVLNNEFGFKRAEASITFANGSELTKQLRELKRNNVHKAEAKVSTASGGIMKAIPEFLREMIEAAPEYGRAKITYLEKVGKKLKSSTFSTEAHPQKIRLRKKKDEQNSGFIERVLQQLRDLTRSGNQRLENLDNREDHDNAV